MGQSGSSQLVVFRGDQIEHGAGVGGVDDLLAKGWILEDATHLRESPQMLSRRVLGRHQREEEKSRLAVLRLKIHAARCHAKRGNHRFEPGHFAMRNRHAFADTVYGGKPTAVDHANVPTAVFSEPEIGVVGLTEAQARERLDKVDVYKTTFRPMKATLSGRNTRSFMKLLVDGITNRVVGCHIIGPDAAELVQIVGIAVKMGATKKDFDATMAVHPTAAEELVTMRARTARYESGQASSG